MEAILPLVMAETVYHSLITMRFANEYPFRVVELIHHISKFRGEFEALFVQEVMFQMLKKIWTAIDRTGLSES